RERRRGHRDHRARARRHARGDRRRRRMVSRAGHHRRADREERDRMISTGVLTDARIDRYSRQIILPEVGGRGQPRLLGARGVVASAVRRPCGACCPAATLATGDAAPATPALAASLALAVGALAAAETLGLLLGAPNAGRARHLDVATGACVALPVPQGA